MDITVVPINDYSLVLGMEFLDTVKAFLVPYANTMSINQDGVPYIMSIQRENKPTKVISSMQLFSDVQLEEPMSKVKEGPSPLSRGCSWQCSTPVRH